MINLLPPETKKQIRAGRTNVLLLRYNFMMLGTTIFLGSALAVAYVYLSTVAENAQRTVAENQTRASQYISIRTEAEAFNTQLGEAKAILNSQINYSKAITNIASVLPSGTSLDSLKLDAASFSKPMTLTVNISGETAAKDLIQNFSSSINFSNVSKGKITVGTKPGYPYTMDLTVTMRQEAAQ